VTLAEAGYEVAYVAIGEVERTSRGVRLIPIERPKGLKGRFPRIFSALRIAIREDAKIYHAHDPELLLALLILRFRKPFAKLVFDSHENFRQYALTQVAVRPTWLRYPLGILVSAIEYTSRLYCSAYIAANPSIANNFPPARTVEVSNYPAISQLPTRSLALGPRPVAKFVYVGNIDAAQRTHLIIEALEILPAPFDATLTLAGAFVDVEYERFMKSLPGWRRVTFLGRVPAGDVLKLYLESTAAVIPVEVFGNNVDARPNKLFECLGCGTPVILTFQEAWREFIEVPSAGWLLRDETPQGLANVMAQIIRNPEETRKRGENARLLIEKNFNWEHEARTLLKLYDGLVR
jgi:glycosyltransferase involved in cell wall biosynthesis